MEFYSVLDYRDFQTKHRNAISIPPYTIYMKRYSQCHRSASPQAQGARAGRAKRGGAQTRRGPFNRRRREDDETAQRTARVSAPSHAWHWTQCVLLIRLRSAYTIYDMSCGSYGRIVSAPLYRSTLLRIPITSGRCRRSFACPSGAAKHGRRGGDCARVVNNARRMRITLMLNSSKPAKCCWTSGLRRAGMSIEISNLKRLLEWHKLSRDEQVHNFPRPNRTNRTRSNADPPTHTRARRVAANLHTRHNCGSTRLRIRSRARTRVRNAHTGRLAPTRCVRTCVGGTTRRRRQRTRAAHVRRSLHTLTICDDTRRPGVGAATAPRRASESEREAR